MMDQCSTPPQLTDDQLSATLDGDADASIADHLACCPWCAARLEHARHLEQRLATTLSRWNCPSPERIGDYHLGLLDPVDSGAIAAHLSRCPQCAAELDDLVHFLPPAPEPPVQAFVIARPQPAPFRRARELIAQIMPRPLGLAVRSGASSVPLLASAGSAMLMITVEPSDNPNLALIGHLAAQEADRWYGALVELRSAEALMATAVLDDSGGFRCEPIPPGPVRLRISAADGVAIVVPEITVS